MSRSERPQIFLNYAATVDGKISTSDRSWSGFGSHRDKDRMDRLRATADAILIGAGTLRHEDPDLRISDPARRRHRLEEGRQEQPRGVVLSRSLDLPLNARFFTLAAERPWVIAPTSAPQPAGEIEEKAEILRTGQAEIDLAGAMNLLWEQGIARLLVEGGGSTNAQFIEADLVDEVYMTLCPLVAGGHTAPTPVDGMGLDPAGVRHLELVESYQDGNEIFCRYRVKRRDPSGPGD